MAQANETKSTADTLTVYKKLSVENDISATGTITQNGNQVISGIKTASGSNIGSVGTPSVTASTSNGTTTLTFDYLKGAKGDTGATGSVASVSTTGSGNAVTSVTMDANKNVTATKGATFLTSHQTLPTSLKNPNTIKFKNTSGTEVSYDGSAAKDLTGGVYYAATAGSAASATSATKATQDGNGNTITSTYVKKSGDTMTGALTLSGESGTTAAGSVTKIVFNPEAGTSQQGYLWYCDYDSYQAPAALTFGGAQGGEYFIAPNIKAGTSMQAPVYYIGGTSQYVQYNSSAECVEFVFA